MPLPQQGKRRMAPIPLAPAESRRLSPGETPASRRYTSMLAVGTARCSQNTTNARTEISRTAQMRTLQRSCRVASSAFAWSSPCPGGRCDVALASFQVSLPSAVRLDDFDWDHAHPAFLIPRRVGHRALRRFRVS